MIKINATKNHSTIRKYIATFFLSCMILSSNVCGKPPRLLKDLDEETRKYAQEAFKAIDVPSLAKNKKRRWFLAIKLAKTGMLTEELVGTVNWDVDRDGNWQDKLRIKVWYQIRDYVWMAFKIGKTIALIMVGWPTLLKGYRIYKPRKATFMAHLQEDKRVAYVGDSINLSLKFDVPDEDKRYRLKVVQKDNKAKIEQVGSAEYVKGRGEIKYKYTPYNKDTTLPKFTIYDTKGTKGIGLTLPYIGDVWYVEPSGSYLTLSSMLAIKEIKWKLEYDENASDDHKIVLKIEPEDIQTGEQDKKRLGQQVYKVKIVEEKGFAHTNRLKITQQCEKIIISQLDKITIPLGASREPNPSLTIKVSYFNVKQKLTIGLKQLYQKKLLNTTPQNVNPTDYFKSEVEKQQYDESKSKSKPLIYAAQKGYLRVIQFYREKIGVDINALDQWGWSALHYAAWNNNIDMTIYLVTQGGDIGVKTPILSSSNWLFWNLRNASYTPEGLATNRLVKDYIKSIRLGHKIKPSVVKNKKDSSKIKRKWEELIKKNNVHAVKRYLKIYDIDVKAKDKDGYTALHKAAQYDSEKVAQLFIDMGVNKDKKAKNRDRPLHQAAYNGSLKVAKLLLSLNAKIRARNESGKNALYSAVDGKSLAIVKLLIAASINVNAQDQYGQTALHRAAELGYVEIAKELIQAGANREATTCLPFLPKKTPLGLAKMLRQQAMVEYLESL